MQTSESRRAIDSAMDRLKAEGFDACSNLPDARAALILGERARVAIVVEEVGGNSKVEVIKKELGTKHHVRAWTRGNLPDVMVIEISKAA